MTRRERLDAAFALRPPDRTPVLGGWIACPAYVMELAGATAEEYWAAPQDVSIRAYDRLGMDGLVSIFVPRHRDDFRCVDINTYAHADRGISLEEAVARIDAMPSAEQTVASFDMEAEYARFSADLRAMQQRCGDMVWMPARWGGGAQISWYGEFGYETFFLIVGLYPDRARKLVEVGGARGWLNSRLTARAVRDGLYPHAVLLGEDICTQRGPMIAVDFMEKHYAPVLRRGLEPLLEAGCRPVWHCDGDVRPLLDMLLDAGVQGLQGFQPECGMVLDQLVERRTRDGEPLLIFGPLAVTTELPVCTPEQIAAKVRQAIEACRGRASLVLFTGNTINPDVPLENIRAMVTALQ